MDNSPKNHSAFFVKERLGDEFTELLDKDKNYKRLTSDRASLCQRLAQGDMTILDQYLELDEEIMEIETHHAYSLGVSDAHLFHEVQNSIDSNKWSELVAAYTSQLNAKLDNDHIVFPKVPRHQSLKRSSVLIAAFGMVICLLTGACIPKLYQIIAEGDTFIRVASGSMELSDTMGENTYLSLEAAAEHYGLENVAPTWVPANYSVHSVGSNDEEGYSSIYAWFTLDSNTEQGISIRIVCYQQAEGMVEKYEMEMEGGEERFTNGVRYYVTQNKQNLRAVWVNGNCLCSISGPVSDSELKQMVESSKW